MRTYMIKIWPFLLYFATQGNNPLDIFWTTWPFVAKLGMVVHNHELECLAKWFVAIFKVKVTVRTYMIKIWPFLLYFATQGNKPFYAYSCNWAQVGDPQHLLVLRQISNNFSFILSDLYFFFHFQHVGSIIEQRKGLGEVAEGTLRCFNNALYDMDCLWFFDFFLT